MPQPENQQPILIITGMHRSGTSLVASLLESGGLDIGEKLVGANEGNVKGHFENVDFVEFHEGILYASAIDKIGRTLERNISPPAYYIDLARTLIKKNASPTSPWGWKEPRTTLFLPFWGSLLPTAKFLLVYRAPWEVLDSLFRRSDDIFDHYPEFALKVWVNYNQAIREFYEAEPHRCLLVNTASAAENPELLVKRITDKLAIPLKPPAVSIYDRSLLVRQASSSHRPLVIQRYFPEAFELYSQLNLLAEFEEEILPELDQVKSPHAWLLQDWLDLRHLEKLNKWENKQFQNQLKSAQELLEESHNELEYTKSLLEQSRQEVAYTKSLLEQSCNEVVYTKSLLEQSQGQVQQLASQLNSSQSKLEQTQTKLQQAQTEIKQGKKRLSRLQANLSAMESSKFWKLREAWMSLRRRLGGDSS